MDLTQVSQGVHKRKLKKRVGRGIGSGHGKTAGRGMKGQYSSAGAEMPKALFEGGQTPMYRRFPKRGFTNARFAKEWAEVNVEALEQYPAGTAVDMALLKNASPDLTDDQVRGLTKEQKEKRDAGQPYFRRLVVGTYDGLRVLGNGELTKKLTVKAHHFTKSAKEKIEKAGGTTEVIPPAKKPVKNKMKPRPPKPAATGG